jgi:hypothetical protein
MFEKPFSPQSMTGGYFFALYRESFQLALRQSYNAV